MHTGTPFDLKNLPSATNSEGADDYTPVAGFGCCTPKITSSPRHHLRDPPPLQTRPPPVICPCPPALRTCCSRVLSHHTVRRALRCNGRCSVPHRCIGNISSKPSISRLHYVNWRCRCLPHLFQTFLDPHAPFCPSHRNRSPIYRRGPSDFHEPFYLPKDGRSVSYLLRTRFIISLRS